MAKPRKGFTKNKLSGKNDRKQGNSSFERSTAEEVQPGQQFRVTIRRIGINGEGVGYYKRKAVFVDGALPEEVVRVRVTEPEASFIRSELVKVETASPERQKPDCPIYAECGGCQLQHISYKGQLAAKEDLVREAFSRYTGEENIPLRPMIGMDQPWAYRNKAQLQTGITNGKVVAGLYSLGTHQLVDITGCPVQHPEINRVVKEVRNLIQQLSLPLYQERQNQHGIRTIVARLSLESKYVQLTIVTSDETFHGKQEFIREVRRRMPEVISISQNVQPAKTPLVFGENTTTLWGKEKLEVTLGKLHFSLSPRAFFQLNPQQTTHLYEEVRKAAKLTGRETVVDAYCGTGTIALWLAPYAKEVRGIELVPEAVKDAKWNAKQNNIGNASFYTGKSEDLLVRWGKAKFKPDVIVVDPPRTGCDRKLLDAVARIKPKRFVYVSCNPSTLAKDCRFLLERGYRIRSVQPVDMFPQTSHVECVVLLERK